MTTITEQLYTAEEYFDFEDKSEDRHEFYYGELIFMPGETTTANDIAGNIYVFLKLFFKGKPFKVYEHDIKLMVLPSKLYRYPDLVVIHKDGDHKKYVTNPIVIVEVLSEGTAEIDREKKRLEYFGLDTLQYYLLVHQDESVVEIYSRSGSSWQYDFYTQLTDSIKLPIFDTQITLEEIFEGIEF
jgi:Uma2 family endonuclease